MKGKGCKVKRSYSMEYLVCGILILVLAVSYLVFPMVNSPNWFLAAMWGVIGGTNIYRAFSPRYVEREEEERTIRRELFGRFAPFVVWGPPVVAVVLMVLSLRVPEGYKWLFWLYLAGILLMGVLVIWYSSVIEKRRKKK